MSDNNKKPSTLNYAALEFRPSLRRHGSPRVQIRGPDTHTGGADRYNSDIGDTHNTAATQSHRHVTQPSSTTFADHHGLGPGIGLGISINPASTSPATTMENEGDTEATGTQETEASMDETDSTEDTPRAPDSASSIVTVIHSPEKSNGAVGAGNVALSAPPSPHRHKKPAQSVNLGATTEHRHTH